MQKFIIKISEPDDSLLNNPECECFILSSALPQEFMLKFIDEAKVKDKIVLTESAKLCTQLNADGVLLDLSKSENVAADYQEQTAGLKRKFIGVISRNRRHEAMLVSECEPDFIAFRAWKDGADKVKELTDWYEEFFLIQAALIPVDDDLDLSAFKTDYIISDNTKYKIFVAKN